MIKSKNPSLTLVAVFECGCVWIRDRRLCDVVKKKKKKKSQGPIISHFTNLKDTKPSFSSCFLSI